MLLGDQDRSLWDRKEIASGRTLLGRAIALHGRGPYVLQAAIASLQADQEINWQQIAELAVSAPERRFLERRIHEL